MDKEQVLHLAKEDMKKIIDELTLPRIPEASGKIFDYMNFLERLEMLPDIKSTLVLPNDTAEIVTKKIEEDFPELKEEPEMQQVKVAHRFERKIKGGWLSDINAFVPEKVVRELELEHGDLVFAEKLESHQEYDGPTRYEFEVAEYRSEPQPRDRVQINWAIVEYQALLGRFVCEKTISGEYIRLGEVIHTALISEKEVIDYQIKDGDIVDLAYNVNNPDNMRVIWRYSIEQRGDFTEISKPVVAPKKKSGKAATAATKKEYPQTLKGKTVLMVGFDPGRPAMQEEVEARGGTLEWSSGREGHDRMFTMVNKADCVINMLGHMGHRGSTNAVEIAKTLDIPHGRLHTFGRNSFVQEVYRCLGIDSAE
jgi:hypothetical protein